MGNPSLRLSEVLYAWIRENVFIDTLWNPQSNKPNEAYPFFLSYQISVYEILELVILIN